MELSKKCSKCFEEKSVSVFYKSKNGRLGVRGNCKQCSDKEYVLWRTTSSGHELSKKNNRKYYEINKDTSEYKYLRLRGSAKYRNKELGIDFDEFKKYWDKPCYYCGDVVTSSGIDRIDSSKGYIKGNIVRCCEKCNRAKNSMSVEDFIEHCRKIIRKYDSDSLPK